MNALDAASAEILELAAKAIGDSDYARRIIQASYDLGRADGGREQVEGARKKFCEQALGAEACVTRDGVIA